MSLLSVALLYASLGAGALLGRRWAAPRELDTISRLTVLGLVGFLGLELGGEGGLPLQAVLEGLLLAAALVALSAAFARGLGARPAPPGRGRARAGRTAPAWRGLLFPVIILVALASGWGLELLLHVSGPNASDLVEGALILLLFEIGWEIHFSWASLKAAPRPLAAAGAAVLTVGLLTSVFARLPWRTSLALVGAFGWYSLAGPVVSQAVGPTLGLVAFLANFFREDLTMVGAPLWGRVAGAEGVAAAGGATAMDTTLFFVVDQGGEEAGPVALATGAILTLLAPVLLALLLGTA